MKHPMHRKPRTDLFTSHRFSKTPPNSVRNNRTVCNSIPQPTPNSIFLPLVADKRFKCTECGDCCTGGGGEVWVNHNEGVAIANRLNITVDHFMETYTKSYGRRPGWRLLKSKLDGSQDCIFLQNKLCSIYGARPFQCSAYPWWPELMSDAAWTAESKACEGILLDGNGEGEEGVVGVEEAVKQLAMCSDYFAEFEAARRKKTN